MRVSILQGHTNLNLAAGIVGGIVVGALSSSEQSQLVQAEAAGLAGGQENPYTCDARTPDLAECGKNDRDRLAHMWGCCGSECCIRRCRKRGWRGTKLQNCKDAVANVCRLCEEKQTWLQDQKHRIYIEALEGLTSYTVEETARWYAEAEAQQWYAAEQEQLTIAAPYTAQMAGFEAQTAQYLSQQRIQQAAFEAQTKKEEEKTQRIALLAGAAVVGGGLLFWMKKKKRKR